jgi:hypothetical protein
VIYRKHCFQKLSKFWQGKNELDASSSNTDVFRWKDICVSSTQLNRTIWSKKETISTLKNMICRKYSFQKQIQLSQGNNVLDAAGSNTDDFLSIDTCVLSSQLNRPIWNKMSLSQP